MALLAYYVAYPTCVLTELGNGGPAMRSGHHLVRRMSLLRPHPDTVVLGARLGALGGRCTLATAALLGAAALMTVYGSSPLELHGTALGGGLLVLSASTAAGAVQAFSWDLPAPARAYLRSRGAGTPTLVALLLVGTSPVHLCAALLVPQVLAARPSTTLAVTALLAQYVLTAVIGAAWLTRRRTGRFLPFPYRAARRAAPCAPSPAPGAAGAVRARWTRPQPAWHAALGRGGRLPRSRVGATRLLLRRTVGVPELAVPVIACPLAGAALAGAGVPTATACYVVGLLPAAAFFSTLARYQTDPAYRLLATRYALDPTEVARAGAALSLPAAGAGAAAALLAGAWSRAGHPAGVLDVVGVLVVVVLSHLSLGLLTTRHLRGRHLPLLIDVEVMVLCLLAPLTILLALTVLVRTYRSGGARRA